MAANAPSRGFYECFSASKIPADLACYVFTTFTSITFFLCATDKNAIDKIHKNTNIQITINIKSAPENLPNIVNAITPITNNKNQTVFGGSIISTLKIVLHTSHFRVFPTP
jgi:hypothetical protein